MDIEKIFKKCISVREPEDKWMLPMRFTKAQEERYDRIEWTRYQRCPAGVTLEFASDADEISFDYKIVGKFYSFDIYCFDIFENGIYTGCVKHEIAEKGSVRTVSWKKKNTGTVNYRIYLPVHSELAFCNFKLGNFTEGKITDYKHKLLVIGDSVSQGLFEVHPSLAYVPQLAEAIDADYLNNSVGGDIFDPDTIDTAQGFVPDVILVALGTNDMCFVCRMEKIEKNMDGFFDKLKKSYPDAKVNVVSMPWETIIEKPENAEMFELYKKIQNAQLKKAKEHGFNAILGWDLIPHDPEFLFDEAHLNDLGASIFTRKLLKELNY